MSEFLSIRDKTTNINSIEEIEQTIDELNSKKTQLINELDQEEIINNPELSEHYSNILSVWKDAKSGNFDSREEIAARMIAAGHAVKGYRNIDFDADLYDELKKESDRPPGIPLPTSWELDRIKFPRSLPSVIGAYSGVGKSRTILNLAYDAIINKRTCLLYSLEMTSGQLLACLCAIHLYFRTGDSHSIGEIFHKTKYNGTGSH